MHCITKRVVGEVWMYAHTRAMPTMQEGSQHQENDGYPPAVSTLSYVVTMHGIHVYMESRWMSSLVAR